MGNMGEFKINVRVLQNLKKVSNQRGSTTHYFD